MCHPSRDRDNLPYYWHQPTEECVKICIFMEEGLCMMVRFFFDAEIFPIPFYENITNEISNEIIRCSTNCDATESYEEANKRIHITMIALYSHSEHGYFRGEGDDRGFNHHHQKYCSVIYSLEKMIDIFVKWIEHSIYLILLTI